MKVKKLVGFILVFVMLFSLASPALALPAEKSETSVTLAVSASSFKDFFTGLFDKIKSVFDRVKQNYNVKTEKVECTMNKNVIHMLKSATDTIGDSFIITTEDGKVIAIDGGHYSDTNYFIEYLKAVTGSCRPHIDAWFLSHAHDDHCEVFLDVVENHACEVTFDKVYANFPETEFYEGHDEWAVQVLTDYYRLLPRFADKAAELKEGDVFSVGAAEFTVFYTFNPEWHNCNEGSTIMRMNLGGRTVMFNGDAGTNAGDYVTEKYGDELKSDICKMAHHGQDGVGQNFYEAVSPSVCLWPTPTWVYENTGSNLKTFETRAWVEELGVKKEYKSFEGTCVIPLFSPRIVTTTDVFEDGYDAVKAVKRLASLGYEGIDMGFDYWVFDGSPFLGDGYLDWAATLKAAADEAGVVYTHAHAPGNAADTDMVERSIRATAAIGAKYLVVHPVHENRLGNTIKTKADFIIINKVLIEKYLPLAKECGVVLLSENILWGASAKPQVIADLVKAVDSPYFGWCFDVGHAWASGYSPSELKKCSVTPLSLHIQDNDGTGDGHLIPGDGTIDWDEFIAALKVVHYAGDCVLEAHHQSLVAPDEERDAILRRLFTVAEDLREKMVN